MGADQQFCLRWNNFHSNITRAFESLRDDEDFVDITLACEGRQVKAHKMVLSACSPYFRSLLKGNPCQHPIVFLKDVSFANLTSILDFMYHGEVNVSHNELATFLKTAEALKVRGLAEDDKKRDSESCNESGSPGPPRDPPDFGSPRPEENNMADAHLTDSPPPHKRRRRSGTSVHSAEDTNETVLSEAREASVKNEPQDFNDEDDLMGHSVIDTSDIKTDSAVNQDGEEHSFGPSDSVSIRTQAAMQQLQESFGSFLPAMSQSSGFLSHGASEMPRPPFSLEGVQGLPPGVSLPGPSMSQGAASQDSSQGGGSGEINIKEELYLDPIPESAESSSVNCLEAFMGRYSTEVGDIGVGMTLPRREDAATTCTQTSVQMVGFNAQRLSSLQLLPGNQGFDGLGRCQHTVTGDEVQCTVCRKFLCNKYVLKVHMRDVHAPRQMQKCPICFRFYSSINSLRVHMSTTHKSLA